MGSRSPAVYIKVVRRAGQGTCKAPVRYRFAGGELVSGFSLDYLAPWRVGPAGAAGLASPPSPAPGETPSDGMTVDGWIGGCDRQVSVSWRDGMAVVAIEGIATFYLDMMRGSISLDGEPANRATLEEALFGPPLVLQLAWRDHWCLHASAVSLPGDGDLVLLCGPSGTGKSTLARWLAASSPAWPAIADDIVPVHVEPGALRALPHFPQFKTGPAAAYPLESPPGRIVRAIVELDRNDDAGRAAWHPLHGREAALVLARHTVCARLFDRHLLARHLAFSRVAADAAVVSRLAFPSGKAGLEDVAATLAASLG